MQREVRDVSGSGSDVLVLRVENGPYWLEVECDRRARLADLDAVLRRTWLECCGHLSGFRFGEVTHGYPEDSSTEEGGGTLEARIGDVLDPGDTAGYAYDFGSTTRLQLRVIDSRPAPAPRPIRILDRNEPVEYECDECGAAATRVCPMCADPETPWSSGPFFCEGHAQEHPCHDDLGSLSRVVDSPRMGVCGYGRDD